MKNLQPQTGPGQNMFLNFIILVIIAFIIFFIIISASFFIISGIILFIMFCFFHFSCFHVFSFFRLFLMFFYSFFLYSQTIPRPNGSKLVLPLFDLCFPFWVLEAGMARLRKARREPQRAQNEEHGQTRARAREGLKEPQGGQNEELLE